MKAITKTNVIGASDYKNMVLEVLRFAGRTVCKTLGPCANASILEEMGPLVSSKDGFHTLQRIKFGAEDIFANNIMNVILRISHRMVSMVGDGSSSAVVAAWKFAEILNKLSNEEMRPREIEKNYNKALEMIKKKIEDNATYPTDGNLPDIMYKTALVSTNWDGEFAEMIREIYTKTKGNTIFSIKKATRGEDKTSYSIIPGYKAEYYYMVDKIFHNTPGEFVGTNCHIICFDMAVDSYHYNMIHHMAALARKNDDPNNPNEVIVVAPSYSQNFLDKIKRDVDLDIQMMNAKQIRHFRIRYMRCLTSNAFQRNEYMDFCMLTGSVPITASDFNDMVNIMESTENFNDEILEKAVGKIGYIRSHQNEYTVIDGFVNRNDVRFNIVMDEVKELYDKLYQESLNMRVPSTAFIHQRHRWNKLQCKMVEITIGAPNEYMMSLKYDAAEDATLACDSVARFGYNIGGNMSIILAADEIIQDSLDNLEEWQLIKAVGHIKETFIGVFRELFANKFTSSGFDSLDEEHKQKIDDVIASCIEDGVYYDITSDGPTTSIINSTKTDIEILNGAMTIVMALMTANQYISQFPNISVE